MAYLILGLTRGNTTVFRYDGFKEADFAADNDPRFKGSKVVIAASKGDLIPVSGPDLIALYNAINPDVEAVPIKKFENKNVAADRVFKLLESRYNYLPVESPPVAPGDAASESSETVTETTEAKEGSEDMATKGKKSKKAKKASAPKKAAAKKSNGGKRALVQANSSRGKLLKLAVENPGISVKSLATRAGVSDEGSLTAIARVRIRLRKVSEGIPGSSVSIDAEGKVTFKLPSGMTLDKAFGKE